MKINLKQFPIYLGLTIVSVLAGCETDILISNPEKAGFREIAWNHLTPEEQAQVKGDWRSAPVQIAEFNGESAAWVTFDSDSFLGPIIVIVDLTMKTVITTLPRF